jgi:hypothetical protein
MVLFFVGNVGVAVAAAYERPVRPAFLALYSVGVGWAIAWWVQLDCRRLRVPTSLDHGWFIFYMWPFALPYHLLRTRGVRGCGLLIALIGVFVVAYISALAVYLLIKNWCPRRLTSR